MRVEELGYCIKELKKGRQTLSWFEKDRYRLEAKIVDCFGASSKRRIKGPIKDGFNALLDDILTQHSWEIVRCRRILEEVEVEVKAV